MNRRGPGIALGLVLALFVAGLVLLFRLRLGQGDLFPVYSSLRADPLGTLALHDSLQQLPGLRVERRMKLLASLETTPPQTILLAGLAEKKWTHITSAEFDALNAAVKAGSRLVIALHAKTAKQKDQAEEDADEVPVKKALKEPVEKSEPKKEKTDPEKKETDPLAEKLKAKIVYADLAERWGVELLSRELLDPKAGAKLAVEPADGLPAQVGWRSDLYFKPGATAAWRVLYRRGGEPVLVERSLGLGSIVLAADSYFLSNEALQRDRPTALLVWIIGSHSRVLFDESHLGVVADPGIAALARRYGMGGAFFTLLLLAALFVWRRMALFVPPPEDTPEITLAYHPAAGLEALLRRAVPEDELVPVGVAEWQRTARAAEAARLAVALAAAPPQASAVARYNLLTRALQRR